MEIERDINKNNLTNLTMIETTKMSSKGQIVIPERIRKKLGLGDGSKLILIEKDDKIIIESEKKFLEKLKKLNIDKEELGWLLLTEENLARDWDNEYDKRWDDVL